MCKEIRLVFHRVGRRAEPFPSMLIYLGLCIMPSGYEVIIMSALVVKGAELYQPVAHDIGIRCESCPHLIHSISRHLIPIVLMTVYYLELQPVTSTDGGTHL